jgi:hypothetical protein
LADFLLGERQRPVERERLFPATHFFLLELFLLELFLLELFLLELFLLELFLLERFFPADGLFLITRCLSDSIFFLL